MQYLFTEGDFLVCMNQETYDQLHIPKILFADSINFFRKEWF
jgi:elongation factor P